MNHIHCPSYPCESRKETNKDHLYRARRPTIPTTPARPAPIAAVGIAAPALLDDFEPEPEPDPDDPEPDPPPEPPVLLEPLPVDVPEGAVCDAPVAPKPDCPAMPPIVPLVPYGMPMPIEARAGVAAAVALDAMAPAAELLPATDVAAAAGTRLVLMSEGNLLNQLGVSPAANSCGRRVSECMRVGSVEEFYRCDDRGCSWGVCDGERHERAGKGCRKDEKSRSTRRCVSGEGF